MDSDYGNSWWRAQVAAARELAIDACHNAPAQPGAVRELVCETCGAKIFVTDDLTIVDCAEAPIAGFSTAGSLRTHTLARS